MSIHDDEHMIDLQIECAKQDDRDGPYAGEDPPEEYLAQEADWEYQEHCARAHKGRRCTCNVPAGVFDAPAPF